MIGEKARVSSRGLGPSWATRLREFSVGAVTSRLARDYSRLYVAGDGSGWVLSHEAREICRIARRLGIPASLMLTGSAAGVRRQNVFHTSQFVLLELAVMKELQNRVAVAYYHGKPNAAEPELAACFEAFRRVHPHLWRVQVPCRSMADFVLSAGIAPGKVHVIPIGVDVAQFRPQTSDSRSQARRALDLPDHAVVIGSFQKDGTGWGDGKIPKLIKGPDILLAVLGRLRSVIPDLHVLLTGPARGYVRDGLDTLGIPYRHVYLEHYADVARVYQAVDLTLVTSREEGGPKAALESMASGVPLVSTRVGQAADLVEQGRNGWLADVEDVDALAHWTGVALQLGVEDRAAVVQAARGTAEQNSYENQLPLWRGFFAE